MADKDIPSLLFEDDKVKITVVGDAEIGKTCLLMAYRPDNSSLVPSIFNSIIINKTVTINDIEHALDIELCDTGSTIEDKKMRIKSYKNVDIILLCFDVINRETLTNINNIWIPEIQQFASENTILSLIGLKGDLRSNKNTNQDALIPTEDIHQFQTNNDQIFNYIETSALRKKNVELAFESAIQQFFTLNLKHRKTTDIAEIDSPVATDIVGTHAKQWSQHLREMGGNNNEDPFAQYKHIAQQQSHSSLNMSMNNGQQRQPSYSPQLSVTQVPGSFAPGPYSMGQQSMMMGGAGMSYQSSNNAFMNGSVAGSYQSQMSFANGMMMQRAQGSQIKLIGLAENHEMNPSVPPPPQQPHPDNIRKVEDSPYNEAIGLKESNVSKDSIPTYKLSEDDDPERTGSIDYGASGSDKKQGGCCVVL